MKKSERNLAVATAGAAIAWGVWTFYPAAEAEGETHSSDDVAAIAEQYRKNLDYVDRGREILDQYYRTAEERKGEGDTTLRPDLAMNADIAAWCRQLSFSTPTVNTETEPIEGVDEYESVLASVRVRGEFQRIAQLMKLFDTKGLIFQDVDLKAARDADDIDARITVSRIVRTPEDELAGARKESR